MIPNGTGLPASSIGRAGMATAADAVDERAPQCGEREQAVKGCGAWMRGARRGLAPEFTLDPSGQDKVTGSADGRRMRAGRSP